MRLSDEQLAHYQHDGFLIFPELLSADEIAPMKSELQRLEGVDTDLIVRERDSGSVKTLYRVHEADGSTASPPFRAAGRSPRRRNSFSMTRTFTSTTPNATARRRSKRPRARSPAPGRARSS